MSIVVFWIESRVGSGMMEFKDTGLLEALKFAEGQRKAGHSHVCISTQLGDQVGGNGVNSVEDGKTPDGHDYEWSKQHRGSGPRKD